jgi:hypothetical protein
MVVGSTITWVRYAFAQPPLALLSESRLGLASGAGRVTLVCGLLALAAVPLLLGGSPAWRRAATVAAVALGVGAAALAFTSIATRDAQVYGSIRTAIGETTGHALTDAEFARLKERLLASGFTVSLGPGLFVVAAGGLLTAAGGLADLAGSQAGAEAAPSSEDPEDQEPSSTGTDPSACSL